MIFIYVQYNYFLQIFNGKHPNAYLRMISMYVEHKNCLMHATWPQCIRKPQFFNHCPKSFNPKISNIRQEVLSKTLGPAFL